MKMNLTEATMLALQNKLEEARSHKEDNERVAPRENTRKVQGYVKRPLSGEEDDYGDELYGEIDIPKRAIFRKGKPDEKGRVWGLYDEEEADTYEQGTPDIERFKDLKSNAEDERDVANYHKKRAKQYDDEASDIVRNKKLTRAQRMLKGKEVFDTEKKTEEKEQTDTNIANTFKNYNAFKNNFGDIIIVKSKYDKEYYFYKTEEDLKNNNYFNHTSSKDYVEGWLYGAVQANNKVVSSIR